MKTKIILILAVCGIALGACSEKNEWDATQKKELSNVSYGSFERNKMDVYLPANRSKTSTKVFVWIHGGGWGSGDKSEGKNINDAINQYIDDVAVVSLNYRLAQFDGSNRFPAQEEDIRSAIEYIVSQTNKWSVSDKLIIAGGSAGGHLSLLEAYKHNNEGKIRAVIAYYPPTLLADMYNVSLYTQLTFNTVIGGSPSQYPSVYAASSPINYLNTGDVPTLFFHGTADDVVPISQSDTLKVRLTELGIPYDYLYFPGEGHGFTTAPALQTFQKIGTFVQQHVP